MSSTNTTEIPSEEIAFHPTSFCDEDGRVFWWKGELYRGISSQYAPFCQSLFETGVVKSLIESGFLIDTKLTDLTLPNYPLVLKHRRLAFVSYASEWCPEMLRDAAQFTLDMIRVIAPFSLTVDIGTWDILFDGAQPRYVDFCSIAAANSYDHNSWNGALDDFYSYFINPLRLMSQGQENLARWALSDYEHRIIHAELAALMGQQIYRNRKRQRYRQYLRQLRKRLGIGRDPCRLDLVQKMQRSLNQISLPAITTPPSKPSSPTEKQTTLSQLLTTLKPATIMDIGCGDGQYAILAASAAPSTQIIAIDKNDRKVAQCYQAAKAKQLPILPLVMNICYPSAAQGTGNPVLASATKRLACEFVMALDLLPFLVYEQHLPLDQAIEAIAIFSTRWLLLEFSSPPAQRPKTSSPYRLDKLISLLSRKFQSVTIVSSEIAPNPVILCDR